METVNIKGKPYVLVNERIKTFRAAFPTWSLVSEIVTLTDERCVMRALVIDDTGVTRATGTAYEDAKSSFINKTSYIENCETSAWGRALGCFGVGIDTSITSAEELLNALNNQDEPTDPIKEEAERNPKPLSKTQKDVLEKFKSDKHFALVFNKDIDSMNTVDYGLICNQYRQFQDIEKYIKAYAKTKGLTDYAAWAQVERGLNISIMANLDKEKEICRRIQTATGK